MTTSVWSTICKFFLLQSFEILDVGAEFRKRKLPVDALVQAFQPCLPQYCQSNYPDPKGMIVQFHAMDEHVPILVWSRFGEDSDIYKRMSAKSLLVPGTPWMVLSLVGGAGEDHHPLAVGGGTLSLDNYDYEHGARSVIPIHWDTKSTTLTIGTHEGSFPGMLERRTFRVVIVRNGRGTGIANSTEPDATVAYDGKAVSVHVQPKL